MIYFLHCELTGLTKVGKTHAVVKRIQSIQGMNCTPLRVVALIDGYSEKEHELHREFARFHVHHEWFRFGLEHVPDTHPALASALVPVEKLSWSIKREAWSHLSERERRCPKDVAIEDGIFEKMRAMHAFEADRTPRYPPPPPAPSKSEIDDKRKAKRVGVKQLAKLAGVAASTAYKAMEGEAVKRSTLQKLERALGARR